MSYLFDRKSKNRERIEGQFGCFECYESVGAAELDKPTGMLHWTCPDGHDNEISWAQPEVENE